MIARKEALFHHSVEVLYAFWRSYLWVYCLSLSLSTTGPCWLVLPSLSPCSLKSRYPLVTMVAPTKARPSVISLDGTSSRLLTINMSTASLHDLNLSWCPVSPLPRCILRKCSNNLLHIIIRNAPILWPESVIPFLGKWEGQVFYILPVNVLLGYNLCNFFLI